MNLPMKALLIILVSLTLGCVLGHALKPVPGPCEPYAEVCTHWTDCTQCHHCHIELGRCSVCVNKR